ncbi:MAG: AgmX/PglI C-terminal domain-containing protein [Sandaracinaceae bacterium]
MQSRLRRWRRFPGGEAVTAVAIICALVLGTAAVLRASGVLPPASAAAAAPMAMIEPTDPPIRFATPVPPRPMLAAAPGAAGAAGAAARGARLAVETPVETPTPARRRRHIPRPHHAVDGIVASVAAPSPPSESSLQHMSGFDQLRREGGHRPSRAGVRRVPTAPGSEPLDEAALRSLLEDRAIRTTVNQNRPHLRTCYDDALERSGAAAARARVHLTVDVAPDGGVREVGVEGASLPGMRECLHRRASAWTFPATERGAHVPLTLIFQPAGGA